MDREPSNSDLQNQDEQLQARLETAGSDLNRVIIFLGFVHKEEPLSQKMLEKGLALCLASAAYIGAGKIALLLMRPWDARKYLVQAFWHYQQRGYNGEALGVMRLMQEHQLISDNQLRIQMFNALGIF